MKVALIQCPLWGTYDPPLALAQLSSCLKQAGYEVYVLDLNIKLYLKRKEIFKNVWAWEQSDFWFNQDYVKTILDSCENEFEHYLNEIINKEIMIVGLSVNSTSELFGMELSRRLKNKNKDIMVIWGGPLFLRKSSIETILATGFVDVVIPAEAENAFIEFLEKLERKRDFSTSQGIVFKKNGQIYRTPMAKPVNLDNLPFLDFSFLPLEDYDDSRHLPMMTSRGCIRRCVFCSDAPCWPGYRAMSGRRIFEEIVHHKTVQLSKFNINISHIGFLDLIFNANMQSLVELCDLLIEADIDLYWTANMCIRPELTEEVINKMRLAKCEHIIVGIESGSERILRMMHKHYKMSEADRIIRQMYEARICVTTNFMFGFPTETEEDFQKTLDFLKRNAAFLSRVYPSRTYCALEEFSYLSNHLEEFYINPNPPNHLFWESVDGTNTYPVRMERCRRFCELALELGIEVAAGVQTAVKLDEWFNLGHYYETVSDYSNAIKNLLSYYKLEPKCENVNRKLQNYLKGIENGECSVNIDLKNQLQECIKSIELQKSNSSLDCADRLKHQHSLGICKVKLKSLQEIVSNQDYNKLDFKSLQINWSIVKDYMYNFYDRRNDTDVKELINLYAQTMQILAFKNKTLNNKEFKEERTYLKSYAPDVYFYFGYPGQSLCIFNFVKPKKECFDLQYFQKQIESKISFGLGLAERFVFIGEGEFLLLSNWQEVLDYLDFNYPYIEKVFSTEGPALKPEIVDVMVSQRSPYTINIWLYASNSKLYRTITRTDDFEPIMDKIRYLLKVRKNKENIRINFGFIASTLSIEDLCDFVKLAAMIGVDKVIVRYNTIYCQAHKYLSCFFKQEFTNKVFDEAENLATDLNIQIDLPPRFALENYADVSICQQLWGQIKFDEKGYLLTCDAQKLEDLNLENYGYAAIWNSYYYQTARRQLLEKIKPKCFSNCSQANPVCINNFTRHVSSENMISEEVDLYWGDNF